ncbi:MAG: L-2-amino-thiazoline-4-carboxylic acid hydrolase [Anaerolineae bacterium]
MDWFVRFPYTAPGYQMQYVEAEKNTVAFDVGWCPTYRCPAADYFARQGLSELCVSAFCDLDPPLADQWGVTLERSQTLAGGATHCNFRFRPRQEKNGVEGETA